MNKLFAILIICSLSLPVLAIEGQEADVLPIRENTVETFSEDEPQELKSEVPYAEETLPAPPETLPGRFKEPTGKKKLAKKFVIAMLCVAGTSVFLYGVLSIYNKLREGFFVQTDLLTNNQQPLDAPDDLTEAVKTFVEKTHWEG